MPKRTIRWSSVSDEALLQMRLCDLPIKLERTEIGARVQRLYDELESRGISFRPHVWFSDEWFSPDDAPGIAIPFYLAHPRLMKLEERMMFHAEGAGEQECMRILRHEAGHALDTAYGLHRRKRWREMFGSFSTPYPKYYKPRPGSRNYVQHLNDWYAQAHPAEDFAETFAVWLAPGSRWRQEYKGWGALEKLEYVHELCSELPNERPKNRRRLRIDDIRTLKRTLAEYYEVKRRHYQATWPRSFDRDLRRIFSDERRYRDRHSAAALTRSLRRELRTVVAEGTGVAPYTIDQLIFDVIARCKQLKLRQSQSTSATKQQLSIMLTVHTMKLVYSGTYQFAL